MKSSQSKPTIKRANLEDQNKKVLYRLNEKNPACCCTVFHYTIISKNPAPVI